MPESDVIRAGPLMTAQILWIEGIPCQSCPEPATHYVLVPVNASELSNRTFDQHLAVLAQPFCSWHSPAVHPAPKPPKKRWWSR